MNLELEKRLIKKIRQLPASRMLEVEDFIDFLYERDVKQFPLQGDLKSDQALNYAAAKLAEPSFTKIWDNSEDAAYDHL